MNGKLTLENGKTIDVMLNDEQLKKILPVENKKTGYERVEKGNLYYIEVLEMIIDRLEEKGSDVDLNGYYDNANYYSDKTLAINNARADKLMRQLRRFAVENAENELDWNNSDQEKYEMYYSCLEYEIKINNKSRACRSPFQVYFDSEETCQKAINTYKDELLWYFTEYRDRI